MAAESLLAAGIAVDLYDAMPSVGRKFLLAGKGGLNLTHAEAEAKFLARYAQRQAQLEPLLRDFGARQLRDWTQALGIETFVGSSQRVFPTAMKAAPLLRAWLHRLRGAGLRIHVRHRWLGWTADGALRFATPQGDTVLQSAVTVLALGGASWSRLGSDGAWVPLLEARGIAVAPLRPANCGFEVSWSPYLRERHAGQPVKAVAASVCDADGRILRRTGEFVISGYGVEGSLVYALSAPLRDAIAAQGAATLTLDLLPDHDGARVLREVSHPRGSRSLASHLQSRLGLKGAKLALLREVLSAEEMNDAAKLAATIKALPLQLTAARPIDEAISSAGGVPFEALDEHLMLKALPGVFCAGEMLDWEAPTGGYLLTACFATGRAAGTGAARCCSARQQQ
ncbi:MAG: TIGR03862 family flavoprotein [Betaproteobacteria bacterium]|nr:TIGR03862 family flavoprotein [Betaproteobacteria bacterium]